MDIKVMIIMGVIAMPVVLTLLFVWLYNRGRNRTSSTTQRIITDRDIIRLIGSQPDGMLSAEQLAAQTGLTRSQAKTRMAMMREFGVLHAHYTAGFKYFYSLAEPIDERPAPDLSPEPFLTVEDILTLFKHFDFRLTPLQLIVVTGLPLTIIKREMKYFQQQQVVRYLTQTTYSGGVGAKSFVLMEPYRSNPEKFLEQQLDLNREMETILKKEDLV